MGLLSVLPGMAGRDPQRIAELEEGVATEADVRARFGEPEKIREAPHGHPRPGRQDGCPAPGSDAEIFHCGV